MSDTQSMSVRSAAANRCSTTTCFGTQSSQTQNLLTREKRELMPFDGRQRFTDV